MLASALRGGFAEVASGVRWCEGIAMASCHAGRRVAAPARDDHREDLRLPPGRSAPLADQQPDD